MVRWVKSNSFTYFEGSDLTMNYKDGSQFKARLVDGTGRALANKTVTSI